MPLTFYPNIENVPKGTISERIEILLEAAEHFKAIVLDTNLLQPNPSDEKKRTIPKDQIAAYNWDEIAQVLRQIREMPEGTKTDKIKKADLLHKLAEIYEVLRAAKMPKLEAVRLALISEANQLRGGTSDVA